jgi:hypothetical protein
MTYCNFLKAFIAQSFIIARPIHSMLALPKIPLFDLDQSTTAEGVLLLRGIVKT